MIHMLGILETLLNERYGKPQIVSSNELPEHRWNASADRLSSVLYKGLVWDDWLRHRFPDLERLYGDCMGGSLLGGCLKVAVLRGPRRFGVYQIEELQEQNEVRLVISKQPHLCFFMDSANVWFYAVVGSQLYVYDSHTQEVDHLGELEPGLRNLLQEWETAKE
jgi:hypothetical protein